LKPDHINVLGVGISAVNMGLAVDTICQAVDRREKGYVCVTGVHGVMESQQDPGLKEIHNRALMCTPDGMPMVWLNRLAGNRQVTRVYGPDLMLELCQVSVARGYRQFFYGGAAGVAAELKRRLEPRFPGLQIVGTFEPPFRPLDPAEEQRLAEQVAASRPDIFWVGLSTPKQERFMAGHLDRLDVPVMIGVGAAFDFHTRRVAQAPRWMQRSGLEWLFRVCREPRRLWWRYLRNNPLFVYYLCLQWLGAKRFQRENPPAGRGPS
jgi:N-acetylglucosaminyldiphosphoundecaprenol N-acetyl-beta-D-mannosaminyltransferase